MCVEYTVESEICHSFYRVGVQEAEIDESLANFNERW